MRVGPCQDPGHRASKGGPEGWTLSGTAGGGHQGSDKSVQKSPWGGGSSVGTAWGREPWEEAGWERMEARAGPWGERGGTQSRQLCSAGLWRQRQGGMRGAFRGLARGSQDSGATPTDKEWFSGM